MCFPDTFRAGTTTQAATDLQRDGFAVMRGCVDGDELRRIVTEYEKKILPQKHSCDVRREVNGPVGEDNAGRVVHISNMYELPALAHVAADPRLLKLASACLGGHSVRPVQNTELFDKPPHGNGSTQTPPHQDNFYFKALEPGVALWITLDEMDNDSGTVRFVHGSHHRGLRYHEWDWGPYGGFVKTIYDFTDEDDEQLRDVGHLYPGDVVVHHGLTIHYAPPNMTSKRRRGLVVNYVAEHVACQLADDLYQPVLSFRISDVGVFSADLPAGWPDRHVLAATSVQCALTGWQGVEGGIRHSCRVDGNACQLHVEVSDDDLRRHAVIALVDSGHIVQGVASVLSLPLQLENFSVPTIPEKLRCSAVPAEYAGVWTFAREQALSDKCLEPTDMAIWLQSRCGIYLNFRIPKAFFSTSSSDLDMCSGPSLLVEKTATGGVFTVHGEHKDVGVWHHVVDFHPFNGKADVSRICSHQTSSSLLLEALTLGPSSKLREAWHRADDLLHCGDTSALELIEDDHGRRGFWVVVGTWFGRVVGRQARGKLADITCKSLLHAIQTYEDTLDICPDAAAHDFEAAFGRVEAPGVFRIVLDFDPAKNGTLLLDNSKRQLRRDSADENVFIEALSNLRWRFHEFPSKCTAFGTLKRVMS